MGDENFYKKFYPLLPFVGTALRAYFAFYLTKFSTIFIDCGEKWEILVRSGDLGQDVAKLK
ncbi:MAG: hypothetical protein LBS22_01400 [Puniceicoccales bacterium]|jgi:hypothetical protein|nr:hypothetical protein [Puniceicoccales bacterium]